MDRGEYTQRDRRLRKNVLVNSTSDNNLDPEYRRKKEEEFLAEKAKGINSQSDPYIISSKSPVGSFNQSVDSSKNSIIIYASKDILPENE